MNLILEIDEQIKNIFVEEQNKIIIYNSNLLDLKNSVNTKLSTKFKSKINQNIIELELRIKNLQANSKFNFYLLESTELLDNFRKILTTPEKINFVSRSTKHNIVKEEIVSSYLKIARKYIYIQLPDHKNKNIICNNCPNKISFDIIDNSVYICLVCGSEHKTTLNVSSSYMDNERVNISVKYKYNRSVHFRDCINQYQGLQNSTISDKVYEDLIKEFKGHHLLDDKNKNIYKNITKHHVHLFLKELGYAKHYENINLIHYKITGIEPDNISYFEDRLMDDFEKLVNVYDTLFKNKKEYERKNFINTQYILYQFLLRYKHPCHKDDFTILKTVDRKSVHDDIAKICFKSLGWEHTPLF